MVEADFVHSRATALRGTVAASLLAGHSDAPAALSARWSRRVVGLVADFCDVPTVAALSATCRDSMRAVHDTRPVPLPAMSAVDEVWTKDVPEFESDVLSWEPHGLPLEPYPDYFAPVMEMATEISTVAWPYGGASISVELLHPTVAAFLENLWVQEKCRGLDDGSSVPAVPTTGALWRTVGGLKAASLAFATYGKRERFTTSPPATGCALCTWSAFFDHIKSMCWQNNIPTWPDESPGSLAGKPVDPSTFFHDVFTSDQIKNGSLHAPVTGGKADLTVDFGVGCLWRREIDLGEEKDDVLTFEWSFVSYCGCMD